MADNHHNDGNDPLRSLLSPSSPRLLSFADELHPASPTKLGAAQSSSSPLPPSSSSSSPPSSAAAGIGREPPPDPLSRTRSPRPAGAAATEMVNDYGAVSRERYDAPNDSSQSGVGGRAGYRASGPGQISLPPSPYLGSSKGDQLIPTDADSPSQAPARTREPSMSLSVATSAQRSSNANNPRRMSFKRRAPSVQQRQNLLQRASMDVFPRRKYSLAASDAGPNGKGLGRVHTTGLSSGGDNDTVDIDALIASAEPSIPRMLPGGKTDPYSTPIPALPFIVLCLVCFGEFSSAGVAGPFLFFMIEDFGVGGESEVGFWAGMLSASFFFAQFLTSLMWASVADKRGRRFVLAISLLGNAVTMMAFGTSQNLGTAIFIRLAQGFFNGAVGVAKGAIRDITDETNEGRAYAQMGFCWGMGGIIGPILGGLLEHPVQKFPRLFGKSELFSNYPYLLPCLVAATFTAVGSVLTLFIGHDGGPCTGAIHLPEKGDIERAANQVGSFGRSAGQRISGYFSGARSAAESELSLSRHFNGEQSTSGTSTPDVGNSTTGGPRKLNRTFTQQVDYETGGPPSPVPSESGTIIMHNNTLANDSAFSRTADLHPRRQRLFSRTEERQRGILGVGSAYGYDRYMSRSSATASATATATAAGPAGGRTQSFAQARGGAAGRTSFSSTTQYAPDFEEIGTRAGLSFAQRFLLAQDDSVFTISDLWVAAAINGDDAYEDVFDDEDDDLDADSYEEGSVIDDSLAHESIDEDDEEQEQEQVGEASTLLAPRHLAPLNFAQRKMSRARGYSDAGRSASSAGGGRPRSMRRASGNRVPSLYANTGIESPLLSPYHNLLSPREEAVSGPLGGNNNTQGSAWDPTLAGIPESHSNRNSLSVPPNRCNGSVSPRSDGRRSVMLASSTPNPAAQTTSLFSLLPAVIIAHYGLMAFHSSTFDQVFMAFLVTPPPSGGLGLTASHFAQLISAMAFCQLIFQFVFYPRVGPPTGPLSHLSMLRLGTAIYLPCYTLFPLLRNFLHPNTDGFVMGGMILFASMRWLANVCAFTAVSVLINAMTPPHLTPLANGLAQTTSSAARFIGPIVGGMVWAEGIQGDWEQRSWPWNYSLGFWFVGLAAFSGFVASWRIR
ncbi:uncharacterized protein UHOD_05927 [Ustilago sp. UG-2017b]|nr:uncharacterized protein UHOD_05927 [Ustilago sp. UG-2017b]